MAINQVGVFTSLIPLNSPAPIAWVLSDIWNIAANNNNIADNSITAGSLLNDADNCHRSVVNNIAQNKPYNKEV